MDLDRMIGWLAEEISGARAKRFVEGISQFDRIQGSPGYDDAIDFVRGRLAEDDVESRVHAFPADGRSKTYEWTSPPAWTARAGVLRQLAPTERVLISYEEVPQSIVAHSAGGRFEGQLVHVEEGTDAEHYDGIDVRGKVVLARGRASRVQKAAGPRGACAILVYPDSERAAADHGLVQYVSLFPRADEIPDLIPAFSISRRLADRLIKDLDRGSVQLGGAIDAEFGNGQLRVLEAWVDGRDPDAGDVVLVAHLCHPRASANDNASGSGLLIEIARTMRTLGEEIGLRHGVRFLWVPEFYGTLPWAAAHVEVLRRARLVVNLDMVGQSPERIGEPLRISRVPNAIPSYVNACVSEIATRTAVAGSTAPGGSRRPLHWSFDVPSGGSDHLVFAAAPHCLPAVMIHHDDPYWHTSLDTTDKVDASRLGQAGILAAALALLPHVQREEPFLLLEWTLAYGIDTLARAAGLARRLDPPRGRRLLEIALSVEEDRLQDLVDRLDERVVGEDAFQQHRATLRAGFEALAGPVENAAGSGPAETAPRARRIVDGPLVYIVTERFDKEERTFFKEKLSAEHRAVAEGLLALCDGRRSAEEIALRLSLDFERDVATEDIARGVELLVKAGYVTLEDAGDGRTHTAS